MRNFLTCVALAMIVALPSALFGQEKPFTGAIIYVHDPAATLANRSDCIHCNLLVQHLMKFYTCKVGITQDSHFWLKPAPKQVEDEGCPLVVYFNRGVYVSSHRGYMGTPKALESIVSQHPQMHGKTAPVLTVSKIKKIKKNPLIHNASMRKGVPQAPPAEMESVPLEEKNIQRTLKPDAEELRSFLDDYDRQALNGKPMVSKGSSITPVSFQSASSVYAFAGGDCSGGGGGPIGGGGVGEVPYQPTYYQPMTTVTYSDCSGGGSAGGVGQVPYQPSYTSYVAPYMAPQMRMVRYAQPRYYAPRYAYQPRYYAPRSYSPWSGGGFGGGIQFASGSSYGGFGMGLSMGMGGMRSMGSCPGGVCY